MLKPPQLAPFETKEQRLYSELPPDVWAPQPISTKAELILAACIRDLILSVTTQSSWPWVKVGP